MDSDSIILDHRYSLGLIRQALHDGYATARPLDEHDEGWRAIQRKQITAYRRSKSYRTALEYLLLYPTIHLYHFPDDYVDLSRLQEHVTIKIVDPVVDLGASSLHFERRLQIAQSFRPILLPMLQRRSDLTKNQLTRLYDSYAQYAALLEASGSNSIGEVLFSANNQGFKRFISSLDDQGILMSVLSRIGASEPDFVRSIIHPDPDDPRIRDRWYMGLSIVAQLLPVDTLSEVTEELAGLLDASGELGAPIAASWRMPRSYTKGMSVDRPPEMEESFLRCFYIFLEEVDAFPVVESIDDVLRLRENRHIENWRQALLEWSLEIRAGRLESEREMRREIRAAMRDLRRVGTMRTISGLMTVLGLPIGVAELVMGIVGPGFALTSVSVGLEGYSRAKQSQHQWLLLGRST